MGKVCAVVSKEWGVERVARGGATAAFRDAKGTGLLTRLATVVCMQDAGAWRGWRDAEREQQKAVPGRRERRGCPKLGEGLWRLDGAWGSGEGG